MSHWPSSSASYPEPPPPPPPLPMLPPLSFPMWTLPMMMQEVAHIDYTVPDVAMPPPPPPPPPPSEILTPTSTLPSRVQKVEVCDKCKDLQLETEHLKKEFDESKSALEDLKTGFFCDINHKHMVIRDLEQRIAEHLARENNHRETTKKLQSKQDENDALRREMRSIDAAHIKSLNQIEILKSDVAQKNEAIQRLAAQLDGADRERQEYQTFYNNMYQEEMIQMRIKLQAMEAKNAELMETVQKADNKDKEIRDLEAALEQEREQRKRELTSRKRLPYGSPANTPMKIAKAEAPSSPSL